MNLGTLFIEPAHLKPERIETRRDREVTRAEVFSRKPIRCLCSNDINYLTAHFNPTRLKAKYNQIMLNLEENHPKLYAVMISTGLPNPY